jgi:hypothetical protein
MSHLLGDPNTVLRMLVDGIDARTNADGSVTTFGHGIEVTWFATERGRLGRATVTVDGTAYGYTAHIVRTDAWSCHVERDGIVLGVSWWSLCLGFAGGSCHAEIFQDVERLREMRR